MSALLDGSLGAHWAGSGGDVPRSLADLQVHARAAAPPAARHAIGNRRPTGEALACPPLSAEQLRCMPPLAPAATPRLAALRRWKRSGGARERR